MALMSDRSWDDWVKEYAQSHQHPVNRQCHVVGIPIIVLSIAVLPVIFWWPPTWKLSAALFTLGWIFQFIGHAFEGKPPEFFKDWRFLLVGTRWWWWKIRTRSRLK